ncbi:MAG: XdhC family protein [Deltaproteobacteria bacterium]
MEGIFKDILTQLSQSRPAVLVTVVASRGSVPRRTGSKMCVFADGRFTGTIGGGALEKRALEEAAVALRKRTSFLKTFPLHKAAGLQVCGGSVDLFFDVIAPRARLLICGGGHIGLALSYIGKLLDFHVTVLDHRRAFAGVRRFPHADRVVCRPYRKAVRLLARDKQTYVVIVTHGHAFDTICCAEALRTPARYIGMIGSRRKIAEVFAELKKRGFSGKDLGRIAAPVGLDIGAETPAEIAVAIAAQLIEKASDARPKGRRTSARCAR